MATATSKVCSRCGDEKPLEAFHCDATKPDGRAPRCAPCKSQVSKGYYERWTPEQRAKHRERVLRHRYGIDQAVFDALVELQEGCCAICGRERPLCVDHDHETGRVRGLLCRICNSAIGKLDDDPALLVKAAAYLIDSH